MVTTKEKCVIDTQKIVIKKKKSKHIATQTHQITKEDRRKEPMNKGSTKQSENN